MKKLNVYYIVFQILLCRTIISNEIWNICVLMV